MSSDCTQGIACDNFSPARLWLRKIAAPLNIISLISKNRSAFLEFTLLAIQLVGRLCQKKRVELRVENGEPNLKRF